VRVAIGNLTVVIGINQRVGSNAIQDDDKTNEQGTEGAPGARSLPERPAKEERTIHVSAGVKIAQTIPQRSETKEQRAVRPLLLAD